MHPIDFVESISVLYITHPSQSLRCTSYIQFNLCGVHHTATASQSPWCASHSNCKSISVVGITQQLQVNPQEHKMYQNLSGMHHPAETISTVCITPPIQSSLCASHHQVNLRSVLYAVHHTANQSLQMCSLHLVSLHNTAESNSTQWNQNRKLC